MTDQNAHTPSHTHEDINGYCATYIFTAGAKKTAEDITRFAKDLMQAVSEASFRHGATSVGHIKAHLEYGDGGFVYADTLGEPSDITTRGKDGLPSAQFKLVINAIIHELEPNLIREATEEAVDAVIAVHHLSKEIIAQDEYDADDHEHVELPEDFI